MKWFDPTLFDVLEIAKRMSESKFQKKFLNICGRDELDGDLWYEISWEVIACIFGDFSDYCNEENGVWTLVFFDPLIEELYQLIEEYEKMTGISDAQDEFRQKAEQDIYDCFLFEAYDYGVRLYDGSHGRPRLTFLYGEEFYSIERLPGALLDAYDQLEYHIGRLRQELWLVQEDKTGKEAA